MVAANHVSWIDVFCVSSVRSTRFIAKSEVRDWPVAGWIAERAGTLFIRRGLRRDTARINEVVHAALAQGDMTSDAAEYASRNAVEPVAQAFDTLMTGIPVWPICCRTR